MSDLILYFNTTIVLAVPILLVALGVCFSDKSGVYGMFAEGSMLSACFMSVLIMTGTGNVVLAVLGAVLTGGVVAGVFSVLSVRIGTHQVLTALAINFACVGLTSSLMNLVWERGNLPQFAQPGNVPIPLLSKIPFIGEVLFDQPVLIYIVYGLVPLSWWILFRSTWGQNIRAVGENMKCADTLGINVNNTRTAAVIVCGMFAGLAGVVLAVQQVGTFTEQMTGAKAWMGIISVYFGGWNPLGATGAALVFGLASALEKRIQLIPNINLSSYVVQMFPYIAAMLVIIATGRNRRHPAAITQYYRKQ